MSSVFLILSSAVYTTVAYTSPGYDDEFVNITAVEQSHDLLSLIYRINLRDVHPPGQYVINYLLYEMLGSWSLTRVAGALLAAVAAWYLVESSALRGKLEKSLAFVLATLSPTLILWCTGLRWPTYFVPLFLLTLIFVRRNVTSPLRFWCTFTILLLGLLHLNYLGILFAPLVVGLALWQRRERLSEEVAVIASSMVLGLLLWTPQLYFFVQHHLPNKSSQVTSFLRAVAGAGQGLFVNFGIFPISVLGVVSVVLILTLVLLILREKALGIVKDKMIVFLLAATALLLLSGVSGKPRNLTPLVPVLFVTLISAVSLLRASWLAIAALLALLPINLIGIHNILTHQNTAKGSWNLPVGEVVAEVAAQAATCEERVVIAVHDPVLGRALASNTQYVVVSPYLDGTRLRLPNHTECLIALLTYRGSIPKRHYDRMMRNLPENPIQVVRLGKDIYAEVKRRFDEDVPDYYVRILNFGALEQGQELADWSFSEQTHSGQSLETTTRIVASG